MQINLVGQVKDKMENKYSFYEQKLEELINCQNCPCDREKFYKGLEETGYGEKRDRLQKKLEDSVFEKIFLEFKKGTMKWEMLIPHPPWYKFGDKTLKSKISTLNYLGYLVEIPVFFLMTKGSGYLTLFEPGESPCRNDADKRVKELWENLKL